MSRERGQRFARTGRRRGAAGRTATATGRAPTPPGARRPAPAPAPAPAPTGHIRGVHDATTRPDRTSGRCTVERHPAMRAVRPAWEELRMAIRFDAGSLAPGDRADAIRELSRSVNGRIEVDLPPDPARLRAVADIT